MKTAKYILMIVSLLLFIPTIIGQKKMRTYNAWVQTSIEPKAFKGFIHAVKDSTIVILLKEGNIHKEIKVGDIHEIMIRRKNRILKGAGIGAASGALFGAIIGFADGDDEPGFLSMSAESKAAGGSAVLLPIGAGLGAAIGSGKKRFPINRDFVMYEKSKNELKKYALQVTE